MDTVPLRRISPPERRTLRRWKRGRINPVNSCRARIILLFSGRTRNKEIAQRVGHTPQWVRIIIHRFNAGGLAGVEWWPPKKLIGMTQWSLSKLREDLIAQKIIAQISLEWLRQLLRHYLKQDRLRLVLDHCKPHRKAEVHADCPHFCPHAFFGVS